MTTITIDRAVAQQMLGMLLKVEAELKTYYTTETEEVRALYASITALRAALAQPVPHGCHVDLDHGMKPDGCVLDDGRPENCIYAKRLLREGKDKTSCEYWKPIEVQR